MGGAARRSTHPYHVRGSALVRFARLGRGEREGAPGTGLPIVQDRTVQWGRINPLEARDFLIRQGLVEGDIQQRFSYDDFVTRNRDILEDAADDASRTRQVAQTVGDEDLFDFYNAIIPNTVTSVADLAKWWKTKHDEQPDLLDFDPDKVERLAGSDSVSLDDYPDHWHTLGTDGSPIDLRLSYIYDPHDPNDGVTVHVPLKALSRLTPEQFSWNVPGLLDELIVGMIKSLPKTLRVQFVPAPDTARKIRAWIDERYPDLPGSGSQQKPNIAPENEDGMAAWPTCRTCSRRRPSVSSARKSTRKSSPANYGTSSRHTCA